MRFVKFCIISRVVIEVIRKLSKEYSRRASFTLFILDKKTFKISHAPFTGGGGSEVQ